jgi:hypothetical protein
MIVLNGYVSFTAKLFLSTCACISRRHRLARVVRHRGRCGSRFLLIISDVFSGHGFLPYAAKHGPQASPRVLAWLVRRRLSPPRVPFPPCAEWDFLMLSRAFCARYVHTVVALQFTMSARRVWFMLPRARPYKRCDVVITLGTSHGALISAVDTDKGKGRKMGEVGLERQPQRCWVRAFSPKSSVQGFSGGDRSLGPSPPDHAAPPATVILLIVGVELAPLGSAQLHERWSTASEPPSMHGDASRQSTATSNTLNPPLVYPCLHDH